MRYQSFLIGFTLAGLVGAAPTDAQILKKIKKTAERAAERETLRGVDRKVTSAVRCAFDDLKCIETAEQEGKAVEVVNGQDSVVSANAAPSAKPGEGAWANYDFVPGERVLFATDLSQDQVGDFPQRLEWIKGNMEVVDWQGGRLLRASSNSRFAIPLPESLPERFTIEFELHDPKTEPGTVVSTVEIPAAWNAPRKGAFFNFGNWRGSGLWINNEPAATVQDTRMEKELVNARIMADGRHVKAYINDTRIANVPQVELARGPKLYFNLDGRHDRLLYIGAIRIAAGGADLYDALAKNGRVATQGIFFATGSDRIQPESTPTLTEITQMLKQHGDLKLTIEGHTDNTGGDAANQQLSEKRAAAVKQYLVQQGIEAARLQAKGLGESKPAASNDTPEGRQQNRRVELVRM